MRAKVLIVFWGLGGGGVRFTYRVACELVTALGPACVRISLNAESALVSETKALGAAVHTVHASSGHKSSTSILAELPSLMIEFIRLILNTRPESVLIPINFAHATAISLIAKMFGIKLIYAMHDLAPHPGDYARTYQKISQAMILRLSDSLVALSDFVAASATPALQCRLQDRTYVAHLNSVVLRIRTKAKTLGAGPVRFLFIGRLLRYKGLSLLAQALEKLADRDDWRLVIAGNGAEHDFVLEAFRRFPQVDLSKVSWLSESDVDILLSQADVLVCPYIEASQSGVVTEAQSYAIPAIVTPVGALMEQVGYGSAGWITKSVTAASIAETLTEALNDRRGYRGKSEAALAMLSVKVGSSKWPEIVNETIVLK